MQKPEDIPEDVWEVARLEAVKIVEAITQEPTDWAVYVVAESISRAILAERERCAEVAERDADWSKFGKKEIDQWEGGPDGARDYRLGIAAGRAIASAIRSQP